MKRHVPVSFTLSPWKQLHSDSELNNKDIYLSVSSTAGRLTLTKPVSSVEPAHTLDIRSDCAVGGVSKHWRLWTIGPNSTCLSLPYSATSAMSVSLQHFTRSSFSSVVLLLHCFSSGCLLLHLCFSRPNHASECNSGFTFSATFGQSTAP